MTAPKQLKVAVIVAHPDDEILWAGGSIMTHTNWDLFIISACRANDEDRAPKFYKVLKMLNAKGTMGNLDDGSKQKPLTEKEVERAILELIPITHFDLIITHNPLGEYTKHVRHEEISKAVINLWNKGKIATETLWLFAYEDGSKAYFPKPIEKATIFMKLSKDIWTKKYNIITQTYGFEPNAWEAQTTPKAESFWQFSKAKKAKQWMNLLMLNNKQIEI